MAGAAGTEESLGAGAVSVSGGHSKVIVECKGRLSVLIPGSAPSPPTVFIDSQINGSSVAASARRDKQSASPARDRVTEFPAGVHFPSSQVTSSWCWIRDHRRLRKPTPRQCAFGAASP